MPPRRREQQSSAPNSSGQTMRQTRQQASRAETVVVKNIDQESEIPAGKLQPSKVPRRFAPQARNRSQSPTSVPTDDLANATDDVLSKRLSDPVEHEQDAAEDQEEDSDADEWISASAQDIMDMVLPDIARCNARLYEHIQSLDDGHPPTRNWWARLKFIEGLYSSARRSLAPVQSHFIDLITLDERLPDIDHDSESFDAARATLCSANLVSLMKLIVQVEHQRVEVRPVIEQAQDGFPVMFDAHLRRGPRAVEVAYNLAFRLHCRFLIEGIQNVEGNPFLMATKVFCSEDVPSSVKQAKVMLLAGPYKDFPRVDVNGEGKFAKRHSELMKALCSHLSHHKQRSEILKELESAYPLEAFLVDLGVWTLAALEETEKSKAPEHISSHNPADGQGPQNLAKRSSLFVEGNESDSDTEPEEAGSIIRLGAPAKSYLDGSARLEEESINQPRAFSQAHLERTATIKKLTADSRRSIPPSNQQAHRKILALDPKEITRAFRADPPTSSRVGSGLPIRSPNHPVHSGTGSQMKGRKRLAIINDDGDENENEDHDDEYETNEKPVDERRRIAKETSITRQPQAKRARTVESAPANGSRRSGSVTAAFPNSRAGEDEPEEGEGSQELEANDIPVLSQQVKTATRLAREREPKPPQRRVFWSAEDTKRLIVAIPEYNCAWSLMEKNLVLSTVRNQQAIRDKVRNVKADLLKADRPLFAGFDGVALSKKEKLAVIAMGRNPDRRESDVDEEGVVINNIWIPEDDEEL